ncbi:Nn.00g012090.m01.CDS01 [Neocucurbitaria sp. VM-36]
MATPSNSTVPSCCAVPVDQVPSATRSTWCTTQLNTCAELCGGQGQTSTNSCNDYTDRTHASLDWKCACSWGELLPQNLGQYQQTVPSQMCFFWFDACVSASGDDASAQEDCLQARDAGCGIKTIEALSPESSTVSSIVASLASQRSSVLRSTSKTSTTSISSATSDNSSSPLPSNQTSGNRGLSGGVIAGIVVGALVGIAAIIITIYFWLKKRRGQKTHRGVARSIGSAGDEKQVAIPIAEEISHKPELHGDYRKPELYGDSGYVTGLSQAAELPAVAWGEQPNLPPSELDANGSPYTAAPLTAPDPIPNGQPPVQQDIPHEPQDIQPESQTQHTSQAPPSPPPPPPPPPPPIETEIDIEPHPQVQSSSTPRNPSPEPLISAMLPARQQLSAADIAALEEEERRIDAEMEEVQRMKELRDQKVAIQRKLREAKG